jgi:ferric-dicitrate binding protein FerR (iron transport regulator)
MEKHIPYSLIAKHLSGETTAEEDQTLWNWLDEHEDHHTIFKEAIAMLSVKDESDDESKIRTLDNTDHANIRLHSSFSFFWKIAASLLIIAILVIGVLKWRIDEDSTVLLSTIQGETGRWILPDSSVVWLNSDSKVRYESEDFLKDRKLYVEGEIFLEVTSQPDQPFTVIYDSILMTAFEGAYNIRNYSFLTEKRVTVMNGFANFIDLRPSGNSIQGSTDENIISRNDYGLVSREHNSDLNTDAWRTHRFVFDEVTTQVALDMLAKDQGFCVDISDPSLEYERINGYYENLHPSEMMLKILELINATVQVKDASHLIITPK